MRERPELADRKRHSRPKEKIMLTNIGVRGERRARPDAVTYNRGRKVLRPVMPAEIGHQSNKREYLYFPGRVPSVQARMSSRHLFGAKVGIPNKNISAGKLTKSQRSKQHDKQTQCCKRTHRSSPDKDESIGCGLAPAGMREVGLLGNPPSERRGSRSVSGVLAA